MTIKEGSVFTRYEEQGFEVEYRDASHRYWVHELIEGRSVRTAMKSVTSALKVLDKPALLAWAEACGAAGALKLAQMGELDDVVPEDAVKLVREYGFGMQAERDRAAARGTIVHRVLEHWGRTGEPPNVMDFEYPVRGYVQGLCAWLLEWNPTPVAIEIPVASRLHGYAGRVDLYASSHDGLELWDLKTNPAGRVYDEAHLQAAAYEGAGLECGFDPDRVMLLAVAENGDYDVTSCHANLDDFLIVLEASRVMDKLRKMRGGKDDDDDV